MKKRLITGLTILLSVQLILMPVCVSAASVSSNTICEEESVENLSEEENGENEEDAISKASDFVIEDGVLINYVGTATEVVIPETVTQIGDRVFERQGITKVTLPSGLTSIGVSVFEGCSKLQSVTRPNYTGSYSIAFPESLVSIGRRAFYACYNIKSVTVTKNVVAIPESCFENCIRLEKVKLVSSTNTIKTRAFARCIHLIQVTIPKSVTTIETDIFGNMNSDNGYWNAYCVIVCKKGSVADQYAKDNYRKVAYNDKKTEADNISVTNRFSPVTWELTYPQDDKKANGTLTISGTGVLDSYANEMPSEIKAHKQEIQTIIIKEGITSIYKDIFNGMSRVQKVTFPEGLTSIGDNAFYMNASLSSVTLPSTITNIGENSFGNCFNLKKVTAETEIKIPASYQMFYGCESLTGFSSGESTSVKFTSVGEYAFKNCVSLKEVVLTEDVTELGQHAFDYCQSLTHIEIPSKVRAIPNQCFYGCSSLENIVFPEGVESIGEKAFCECRSLRELQLPSSLKQIGEQAFYDNNSLKSLVIPENVEAIEKNGFESCDHIESVTFLTSKLETVGHIFDGCFDLRTLVLSDGIKTVEYIDGPFLDWVYIPDSVTSFPKSIIDQITTVVCNRGSYAESIAKEKHCVLYYYSEDNEIGNLTETITWSYNYALKKMTIQGTGRISKDLQQKWQYYGDQISEIEVKDGIAAVEDYGFEGLTKVEKIVLPKSMNYLGKGALKDCTSLKEIVLPEKIIKLSEKLFEGDTSLSKVVIPEGISYLEAGVFIGCKNLKEVYFPRSIQFLYANCFDEPKPVLYGYRGSVVESLATKRGFKFVARDPENAETKPTTPSNNNQSSNTPSKDSGTTNVPGKGDGAPSKSPADAQAEYSKTKLTIGTKTDQKKKIPSYALKKYTKVKEVVIGDYAKEIKKNALRGSKTLTKVTVGKNVNKIGADAFSGCGKLKTIVIKTTKLTEKNVAKNAFKGIGKNVTIKVPKSKKKAYKKLFVKKGLSKKVKIK